MKRLKKIFFIWFVIESIRIAAILTLPNNGESLSAFINQSIQILLFLISLNIFLCEPTKRYKFLFLNFTLFFSTAFLPFILIFIGKTLLINKPLISFYFFQYTQSLIVLLQAFAIFYLVIDYLFRELKIYQKYIITSAIVGGVFVFYFNPFIQNPNYLYTTENIKNFKVVDRANQEFIEINGKAPSIEELTAIVPTAELSYNNLNVDSYKKLEIIKFTYPYLEGHNYITLLYQPLYFSLIYIHIFILLNIFLYLGYYFGKDPPQGAYIDKIMYVFLIIAGFDIFHHWAIIKSVEFTIYNELFAVGQYFTCIAFFMLLVFFYARLRFINSVVGEFYETELQINPEGITRWIDGIDKFVMKHFSYTNAHKNRLFEKKPVK